MNLTERRERFRRVLAGDQCVYTTQVFDPISARITEDLGFELALLSGSMCSVGVSGGWNLVMLTSSEFAEQIRRICRASSISLWADTDHGYGNALNVMRTVEEFETAGVSAISIGDSALPISFGNNSEYLNGLNVGLTHVPMIPLEEAVGKMKAALAARQDPSLVVAARTNALKSSIPEGIRRVRAYERAGVDAVFLASGRSREGVAAVHAETRVPLLISTVEGDLADKPFLSANGVRVGNYGHLLFQVAVKAMYDALKALRDGKSPEELWSTAAASEELLAQVTRQAEYSQCVKEFMS